MMTRGDSYTVVARKLSALSDEDFASVLAAGTPVGMGIGGAVSVMDIDGVRVFVKMIPLADVERQPENLRSTANIFSLPVYFQYGVSSAGFGAWRELAVHLMTTDWVLAGECPNFPLLYHWRVMPRAASSELSADQAKDVERQFASWGSEAVRERFSARYKASASIVLVLEWFPCSLRAWLGEQLSAADDAAMRAALSMVENDLLSVTAFMGSQDLLHFDAHSENILTDGHRLYFTDFGQALSAKFNLAPDEAEFFEKHRDYDKNYVVTILFNLAKKAPAGAAIVERYAEIAALTTDFFGRLCSEAKTIPYPFANLSRAWKKIGSLSSCSSCSEGDRS